MHLVAGIDALDLPSRFAAATKRIILHAAVYGPFAESKPHREALTSALRRHTFQQLDIIALKAETHWARPFMEALRFGATNEEKEATLTASTNFLHTLKTDHPGKVRIHPHSTIPCMPLVIVDDTIIFGQYAHCAVHAAQGFWGIMEADVHKLFGWAEADRLPETVSGEEVAAYRLISECHHAMRGGAR